MSVVGTSNGQTPRHLRDGVAAGILESIKRDVELRGGATARRLIVSGILGVVGALSVTELVLIHPLGHHPTWHVVLISVVWAGLLIVSFAIAILRVRTPSLPLADAILVGMLGLGLAGVCAAACSDQHFLNWWGETAIGESVSRVAGPTLSAMCLGLVITPFLAAVPAFVLWTRVDGNASEAILPASILLMLLAPGIALQSYGTSFGIFFAWMAGTAFGAYLGVLIGIHLRSLVSRTLREWPIE